MKTIVLAAGYATRLYPLTENTPKPLLPIKGSTILDRMMADIDAIDDIDEHIVICNHKFVKHFESWREQCGLKKCLRILDDGSTTNDNRLGAVADLLFAIRECHIEDDMLVVAADNLLDFSFRGFVEYAKQTQSSCIMCHYEPSIEKLQRTGVIHMDEHNCVLEMQEKPHVPASHWAVPPFYVYLKKDIALIEECLKHGCGNDAPGNLAHYLVDRTTIHAWQMPGTRIDIGSLDTYNELSIRYE